MNETSFTRTGRVTVVLGGAAGIGREFGLTLQGVAISNPVNLGSRIDVSVRAVFRLYGGRVRS